MAIRTKANGPTLSVRTLNRTLLARHHLLARTRATVEDMLEWLVGLQAQATKPPYLALHARMDGFTHEALSACIEDKRAVRIALFRSTIHLVTARDCVEIRPLLTPAIEYSFWKQSPYGKRIVGLDTAALARAARKRLERASCTTAELGVELAEKFPGYEADPLAQTARTYLPLVQIPPRGLWHDGGRPVCATAEQWLGTKLAKKPDMKALVLRYLRAFGPASVRDAQAFSGLRDLGPVFEALRPGLRVYADPNGKELFDTEDGVLEAEDAAAPPRFMPEYDNVMLSHHDRSRIVSEAHRSLFGTPASRGHSPLLIDGFVRGSYRVTEAQGRALLTVRPFEKISAKTRADIAEEGERFLAFYAESAEDRDVTFARG